MNAVALGFLAGLYLGVWAAQPCAARVFEQALPGYKFSFPRDHYSHESYKTEWWYYTGHLKTKDNKHYGYELTFFRNGTDEDNISKPSEWQLRNIYLAHFAISDENNKTFHFYEKLNRQTLNLAAAREDSLYVKNEGWLVEDLGGKMHIQADTPQFGIHLLLDPEKGPVVHGQNGVSQKASCKGCASHYYSMTKLNTKGLLFVDGKPTEVEGQTWMDHEFGSNQLTAEQVGWDWYSLQLDNNMEIMLYAMRNANGTRDVNSSGTLIYPDGKAEHILVSDFKVGSSSTWTSPTTKGVYPVGWHVSIPKIKAELTITPAFENQELVTSKSTGVSYWEGSSTVSGTIGSQPVKGQAYVEMTGYAERFKKHI